MDFEVFRLVDSRVGAPLGLSFCFCGVFLVALVYVEIYKE